jgi:hypothetical protein
MFGVFVIVTSLYEHSSRLGIYVSVSSDRMVRKGLRDIVRSRSYML